MGPGFVDILVQYGLKNDVCVCFFYVSILNIGSAFSAVLHIGNHDPFQNQEPTDTYLPSWLKPGNLFNFIFTDLMPMWYIIGVSLITACARFGWQTVDPDGTQQPDWKKRMTRSSKVIGSWILFVGLKKSVSSIVHFNMSGHFMTLTSASISLILEYLLYDETDHDSAPKSLELSTKLYVTAILVIWSFVLLVTSVFYHTFPEKIVGLGLAFLSLYGIYSTAFDFSPPVQDETSMV